MTQNFITAVLILLVIMRHVGIIDWPWASVALPLYAWLVLWFLLKIWEEGQ